MKKKIKLYRNIKIAELVVFAAIEIVFLIVLLVNKTLRTSIFIDKSLFTLCSVAYITVLCAFVALIYDFISIHTLKEEAHNLENLAFLDKKTGMPNRTAVNEFISGYNTPESLKGLACVVTEISNIKEINSRLGKAEGDKVIAAFTKLYEKCADGYGFVGRNGGNEFITVIEKCDMEKIQTYNALLNNSVENYNRAHEKEPIELKSEYVLFDSEEVSSFSELVSKAYSKLGR